MKVLVVGSGGREHALCWALAGSPIVDKVWCAPGNAGIARDAQCVPIAATDLDGIVDLAQREHIDLVVVGPEAPLVLGLVDRLTQVGIKAFGPTAAAAQLEGSKAFTKRFCVRHGIPTAAFRTFGVGQEEAALAYVAGTEAPIVVKADGLAAGKGVVVAFTVEEAQAAIRDAYRSATTSAGDLLVIEEFMQGEEASLFALCDGATALEIGTARDFKRVGDDDVGPNTGGMGAYSPADLLTPDLVERAMADIVHPTLAGMAAEGTPFKGFLYAGLMLTAEGPKLVEYNVRFGDPECQVVLPRLMTDLCQLILGAVDGVLAEMSIRWRPEHALTVVLATRGYPGHVEQGSEIRGLPALSDMPSVRVFHAATHEGPKDNFLAAGGRVLSVTGLGSSLEDARDRAYAAVDRIDWPEGFCRRDIGRRAIERTSSSLPGAAPSL
ncbi:MAG: phosphoribosylamine--glycine ligase [Geminicoccaceae bacterium]